MINKTIEGRCMKCKKQVEIENAIITKTSRGVNIAKGVCGKCGTKVCRMLLRD